MKIIMLGAPGAGKGTQAIMIGEHYALPHISTGDIFRANIKNGTVLGQKAKSYMDQGLLVPDELTCDLVVDRIQQPDAANGYVLDGFPRTIPQAECLTDALQKLGSQIDYAIDVDALSAALAKAGTDIDYAIDVEVPDENIVERMSGRRVCLTCGATYHTKFNKPAKENTCDHCGDTLHHRDDDKPETVNKRLSVYHEQTQPLIEYYKGKGKLRRVDGTRSVDEVFAQIREILGE